MQQWPVHELQVKRRFRLTRSIDIKRVRDSGKSYAHPLVVLLALASDAPQPRVGFLAGQAVGGAVQRNRAKRLMREVARPLVSHLIPGNDLLLIARRPLVNASSSQVQAAVTTLLQRASLLLPKDG
jgi:ribonuclease P protein component